MKKLVLIGLVTALPTQVHAQVKCEVSVEDLGPGVSGVRMTQMLQIPDEIGFAIVPYGECLSNQRIALEDEGISLYESPESAAEVLARCASQRDEAIFLASTALERRTQLDLEPRREMIFETLSQIQDMTLSTGRPACPGNSAPEAGQ